jgi:hypothetical protein
LAKKKEVHRNDAKFLMKNTKFLIPLTSILSPEGRGGNCQLSPQGGE